MSPVADVILEREEIEQQLDSQTYKQQIYQALSSACALKLMASWVYCKTNKQLLQKQKKISSFTPKNATTLSLNNSHLPIALKKDYGTGSLNKIYLTISTSLS